MKVVSVLTALALGSSGAVAAPADLSFSDLMATDQPIKRAQNQLQQVTGNWGSNPSNTGFYIYTPSKIATKPAIIVAIHYCTGTAQAYFTGSPYAGLADQKGFIVIYPSSPYSGTCWDVSSKAALTHNGGGDSNSIANMVTYAISKYSADASKVFVTGSSSGAMMTVGCSSFLDVEL
jgi:acetylxylan esterase